MTKENKMYKAFVGRPTKYYEGIVEDLFKYIKDCMDTLNKKDELRRVPSIEGFALTLCITKETLYQWEKQESKKEFSDAIKLLRLSQREFLYNGGSSKVISEKIAILLLSTHGVIEKKEVEVVNNEGALNDIDISKVSTETMKELYKAKKVKGE